MSRPSLFREVRNHSQFPPVPALRPVRSTGLRPGLLALPRGRPNLSDGHLRPQEAGGWASVRGDGAVQGSEGRRSARRARSRELPEKSYLRRPIQRFLSLSLIMSP